MPLTAKEMMLTVGQKLTADIVGEKFDLAVRGWFEGSCFMLDVPIYKNEPMTLAALTGCKINFVKDGTYIRFQSKILRVFYQAPPFMLIAFPNAVDKTNLRKYDRVQVQVPIQFRVNGSPLKEGLIRDLCLGGALITSELRLVKGDKVSISMNLKLGKLDGMETTVQNVREFTKNRVKFHAAGLKFIGPSQDEATVLQSILDFQKNQSSLAVALC